MKKITLAPVLRARALEALKATWPTVLVGSALINLASYVLNQVLGLIPVLGAFLSILVMALLTIPMLGLTSGVLGYYRGKPLTLDCVKAMFPHWQKVCLLYLWTMLCLMGWIVLGMLPMLLAMLLAALLGTAEASGAVVGLVILLYLASIVLMLVLVFRAALNYSMANCILVDDPSTGVRETLRKSKAMIRGYRWYSVKVQWPVLVVILIAVTIIGGLTAALPVWLASLISSVMVAFTGMMTYYFQPVVYVELRRIGR